MAFGGELILFAGLGFVMLGPKQMNVLLRRIGKAKAEFDRMSSELKKQLESECHERGQIGKHQEPHPEVSTKLNQQ